MSSDIGVVLLVEHICWTSSLPVSILSLLVCLHHCRGSRNQSLFRLYRKMFQDVNMLESPRPDAGEDKNLTGKALMKHVMQSWINAGDALVSMVVTKLPAPKLAQRYRVENLYDGPMDTQFELAEKKMFVFP